MERKSSPDGGNSLSRRFWRLLSNGLPSILAGLFILSTWILILGFPRSGLAGALAVGIMVLPIIIRSSDLVLRLVPNSLREAAYGLGASNADRRRREDDAARQRATTGNTVQVSSAGDPLAGRALRVGHCGPGRALRVGSGTAGRVGHCQQGH